MLDQGRREFQCIGETTSDKYEESIAKDPAFEEQFEQILVKQLTVAPQEKDVRQEPAGFGAFPVLFRGLRWLESSSWDTDVTDNSSSLLFSYLPLVFVLLYML